MPKIPGINHLPGGAGVGKGWFPHSTPRQTHRHERRFPLHHHTASQSGKRADNGRDCQRRRNVRSNTFATSYSGKLLKSLKNDARLGVLQPGFLPATNDKCARTTGYRGLQRAALFTRPLVREVLRLNGVRLKAGLKLVRLPRSLAPTLAA